MSTMWSSAMCLLYDKVQYVYNVMKCKMSTMRSSAMCLLCDKVYVSTMW